MARFEIPTVDPVTRGDYERIEFTVMQAKENETDPDVPQNITGWDLRASGKFDISDTGYVFQKSSNVAGDFEIEDATAGKGFIVIMPDDLDAVTYETTLICDLEAMDISGKPYTTKFYLPVELGVTN